ncbi:MAG: hypothetical protein ABJC13_25770 [Acidobacteriota bacterium]
MSARKSRILRWFGRILATDLPFVVRLPEGAGDIDVTLTAIDGSAPEAAAGESYRRIFPAGSTDTEPWLEAFAFEDRFRLRFEGYAEFEIGPDRIGCRLTGGTLAEAETFFLGLVSALWLESKGALCLHGAAVVAPSGAVGFLGFNRAGKSSLAASFLRQGIPLLTDDVLALDLDERRRVMAQPGFPQIRLWPASAADLVENAQDLEPVHPDFEKRRVPVGGGGLGTFHDAPAELRALMLPQRKGSEIELNRLPPREATIELVRHSFLGGLGEAAIGVDRRFERLAAVAEAVPVFHLVYPDGLENLPQVREAILKRLKTL